MGFPGSVLLTGQDVLTTTSAKIHPLGTRGYTRDGRVFRYARNAGTALVGNLPVQSAVPITGELTVRTGTTKLRGNSSWNNIMTSGTGVFTTANAYTDGYLYLRTSSTAVGGRYAQIKSHTTQTATATGKVVVQFVDGDSLYSPTTNVGTTLTTLGVRRNPYDKVVVKPSGIVTALVVGVPVRPITANYYFWLQTWGPCPVRGDTVAYLAGRPVGVSTNTSARITGTSSTKPTSAAASLTWTAVSNIMAGLGVAMNIGVSGQHRMIFLKLAP